MSKFVKVIKVVVGLIIAGNIIAIVWYNIAPSAIKEQPIVPTRKLIKMDMTYKELQKLDCQGIKIISSHDVKHKINDNRFRVFYRYSPQLSVAMLEIDLKSYFELVFENDKIKLINKYRNDGVLIDNYNDLYCD